MKGGRHETTKSHGRKLQGIKRIYIEGGGTSGKGIIKVFETFKFVLVHNCLKIHLLKDVEFRLKVDLFSFHITPSAPLKYHI